MGDTLIEPQAKSEGTMYVQEQTVKKWVSLKAISSTFSYLKPIEKNKWCLFEKQTAQLEKEPKDPDTCNVFAIYKLIPSQEQIAAMRANYERQLRLWSY
jgi:tryptophanyl-tRNA synthetase